MSNSWKSNELYTHLYQSQPQQIIGIAFKNGQFKEGLFTKGQITEVWVEWRKPQDNVLAVMLWPLLSPKGDF